MTPTFPTLRRADRRPMVAAALCLLLVLTFGCSRNKPRIDPILQLSTQDALTRGKDLMAQEKFTRAQRYLDHAFESSPNSREGREALLLAGDALFRDGGEDNHIRCEAKYRDFLNRFPTSDRSDYAQFQVANCLAERMKRPDRDQGVALEALKAYEELFRLFPTSPYAQQGRERANKVIDNLAEAEIRVAEFYIRYRLCQASIDRLEPVPDSFPSFSAMDRVWFFLGVSYEQCGHPEKADAAFEQLATDFPNSALRDEVVSARKEATKKREKLERRRRGRG